MERKSWTEGKQKSDCLSCVETNIPGGGTNAGLKECLNVDKLKYEERPKGKKSKSTKTVDLCACQDSCELQGAWGCSFKPNRKPNRKGKCNCLINKKPKRMSMKRFRGGSSLIFDEKVN